MHSSFSALNSNQFSRKWAGTSNAVDPYISGYFFTKWDKIPADLTTIINEANTTHGVSGTGEIQNLLAGSCLAVTLPGGTVNKAEYMGLGGVKFAVPTNVEFDNTVTVKFLEFSTLPIFNLIHGWVRMIRDYSSGVSEALQGKYTKSAYSCNMYYWTTKPGGVDIEYAACVSGMFPLKDPTDLLGADLSTYDKLEIDIDFNADYIWHESWVYDKIVSLAAQTGTISTYDQ